MYKKQHVYIWSILGVLAGGTASGHVALWKYSPAPGGRKQEPEDKWKLQPPSSLPAAVNQLAVSIAPPPWWIIASSPTRRVQS